MTTIQPLQAILLGALEGLTEFLPISSTGHLILASRWLELRGEAVDTFTIVIQAGALVAVVGLYRARVAAMWRGLLGRDAAGRRLLTRLAISFAPAAVVGLLLHETIKERLFSAWPVVGALAVGGLLMIGIDRWVRPADRPGGAGRRSRGTPAKTIESVTIQGALLIGCAQCLALWPGTSRAMVTIVAGILLGLSATAAAEYSFLLALPTLGAATLFDAVTGGQTLVQEVSVFSLACGFLTAAVVAALAIRGFIQYLTRRGLGLFGWYRLGVAAMVWVVAARS